MTTAPTPAPVAGTAARPERTGPRNTWLLTVFTAVTNLADGVTKLVVPLMAAHVTGSPLAVSAVTLSLTLPWLLTSLHVGVLVDRFDRRLLLWLADGVRALSVVVLMAAVARGGAGVPLLFACGLVLGIAEVVALTAAASLVPAAVAGPGRERANAWMAGAETVCNQFAGPLVGAALLAAGTAAALGATAVTYVLGTLILLPLVPLAGRFRADGAPAGPVRSVHGDIRAGLAFLWGNRLLRTMALTLTVMCACWGAWMALIPLAATRSMGADDGDYGVLMSALGLGGVVGAVTVGLVNRVLGRKGAMFADLLGTLVLVATPWLTSSLVLNTGAAFLGGMGGVLWSVNSRTIGQSLVPDALLGRYTAALRMFSWGALPLGSALAGALAQAAGLSAAFAVFSLAAAGLIVPFLRWMPAGELTAEPTARGKDRP
ncbi:MFS transporter [Streptomyces sp. NPDC046915]|uniref:MFS transporter n=1 Tax=Streptomyces sp. NPDC046915 TaxID=3155257 RepID=UPI0034056131